MMTIAQAHSHCDRIAAAEAKNFYWAFRVLPKHLRQGMTAVYAFARETDDLADNHATDGEKDVRAARIRQMRTDLRKALAGEASWPVLAALADTVARFSLSSKYLEQILDGAEQDLTVSRYATFGDLLDYCRLVASSVGLITLELFDCRNEKALPLAENLGIALQLTNILRDVREDAARGRIYLPQEDLLALGCSEADILNGTKTEAFLKVCTVHAARAREHFDAAHPLLFHLSSMARRTVSVMALFYAAILEKIESGGFPVLERRVALSRLEKMFIFLGVLFNPTFPAGAGGRGRP